jgi:predicted metal-dependent enzyme (double-stranded beta helix superfamily)
MLSGTASPALDVLVARLREALADELSPLESAKAAAKCLRDMPTPDAILTAEQRSGSDEDYVQHVLHVNDAPLFSVVGLVWRSGQQTRIHSHVCWGAVGVMQGAEEETTFRLCSEPDADQTGEHLHKAVFNRYTRGAVTAFAPPTDIHQVRNGSDEATISIHVYGADLRVTGTSILRVFPPESIVA